MINQILLKKCMKSHLHLSELNDGFSQKVITSLHVCNRYDTKRIATKNLAFSQRLGQLHLMAQSLLKFEILFIVMLMKPPCVTVSSGKYSNKCTALSYLRTNRVQCQF